MIDKIKIPFQTKLFFIISLLGITFSLFLIFKLNLLSNDYTSAERARLNLLFIFILTISSIALYKGIATFQSKSFSSKNSIQSKILILKKFAEKEKFGIVSETENKITLLYKSGFLGFYEIIVFVNTEKFEYNIFELGGKPFDWGIRKKLFKKIEKYFTENCNNL